MALWLRIYNKLSRYSSSSKIGVFVMFFSDSFLRWRSLIWAYEIWCFQKKLPFWCKLLFGFTFSWWLSDFKKNHWPHWRQQLQPKSQWLQCGVLCFLVSRWILEALSVRRLVSKIFHVHSCGQMGSYGFCYQFDWFYMILRVSLVNTIPESLRIPCLDHGLKVILKKFVLLNLGRRPEWLCHRNPCVACP